MSDPLAALRAVSGTEPETGSTGLPNIPAVPATEDAAVSNFLQAAKLWMEKAAGDGFTGFASKSDLIRNGILQVDSNGNITPTNGVKNLAIPPVPTGLTASGAMTNILVQWDNPHNAYSNHGYTEVWAAETNDFTGAVLVGESSGFIFAHSVGQDSTRYYWIRFVSTSGVKGPYNSVNGTMGQTAKDPQYMLDTLTGQLTESQLYADLNSRIDLIDGPSTTIGTIPFQLAQLQGQIEAISNYPDYSGSSTYASGDIVKYNGAIYKATQATTGNLPTNTTYWLKIGDYSSLADAVAAHTTQIGTLTTSDTAQASQISTLVSEVGKKSTIYRQTTAPATPQLNDIWIDTSISYSADYFTDDYGIPRFKQYMWNGSVWVLITDDRIWDTQSALQIEQTTRANADSALSSQITTLSSTVTTNYDTLQAAIQSEQSARATADSALATDITTLAATVTSNNTTVNAAITNESSVRSTADSALGSQINTIQARLDSGGDVAQAIVQAQTTATTGISNASSAQATADSKVKTYAQATAPASGMTVGDLWVDTDDGNKLYRWNGGSWDDVRDTAATTAFSNWFSGTYATDKSSLQSQVDAKIETWFQSTDPSENWTTDQLKKLHDGDLWYNASTKLFKRYSRTGLDAGSWTQIDDATAVSAAAAAATAQSTADGKIVTFYQSGTPTAAATGDLWIKTNENNKLYRWNGSAWLDASDVRITATASQVNTIQTTVNGHTTSIQTNATSIDGIQGKYTVKIDNNGYVSGFGLISTANNATPTSEFMVVADKFSIAPVASNPDAADGSPFFYLTVPTVVNGVSIPAGAYMKAAYIHDAAITNAKIANAAIDSAKIADAAIVTAKIGDAAITTAKIQDAAITTAKIQNAAITNALIADAQITSAKIADATITSAKIVNAAITSAKIGAAAVDTLNIANNAVTVPVSATGVSSASTASSDFGGQPVAIIAFCGGTFSSPGTSYMRIYRDTTLLATYDFGFGDYYPSYCAVFIDTPTYGSHYYKVEASGPTNWRACGITALGVKR